MQLNATELNVECGLSFVNTPLPSKMVLMYLSQKLVFLTLHMKDCNRISKKYLKMRKLLLKLLWLYQRFFTLIGFGSCRYYPSCSEFARLNFKNNSISSAFYHSFTRILRCNQFFDGGIEYPLLEKLSLKPKDLKLDTIQYWLVPNKKNQHYIIKNFSYKG